MKQARTFRAKGGEQEKGLLDLVELLPDDCTIVELGSAYGESAEVFLSTGKVKQIICVDPWTDKEREPHFDARHKNDPRVKKIKAKSEDVVQRFPDDRYDCLYIDAQHTLEAGRRDIINYLPKVKVGGYISGHDYTPSFSGLVQAIDELLGKPKHLFCDGSWAVKVTKTLRNKIVKLRG